MIRAWRVLAAVAPLLAAAPAPDPLAEASDLFGVRLGMTRAEVTARAPESCVKDGDGGPDQLFLTCGDRKLSAGFTAAGRAWWVTASYDLTDTPFTLAATRAALLARFGRAVEVDKQGEAGTLVWRPSGSRADAGQCVAAVTLLTAVVELRGAGEGGAKLPAVPSGCLPLRSAILAKHAGHHGLIVQDRDPRARMAELAR